MFFVEPTLRNQTAVIGSFELSFSGSFTYDSVKMITLSVWNLSFCQVKSMILMTIDSPWQKNCETHIRVKLTLRGEQLHWSGHLHFIGEIPLGVACVTHHRDLRLCIVVEMIPGSRVLPFGWFSLKIEVCPMRIRDCPDPILLYILGMGLRSSILLDRILPICVCLWVSYSDEYLNDFISIWPLTTRSLTDLKPAYWDVLLELRINGLFHPCISRLFTSRK